MGQRNPHLRGCARSGNGRIDIADDDDEIRLDATTDFFEAAHHPGNLLGSRSGSDTEAPVRGGQPEIAAKYTSHRIARVLTGVDEYLGEVRVPALNRAPDRSYFHVVRPRANYVNKRGHAPSAAASRPNASRRSVPLLSAIPVAVSIRKPVDVQAIIPRLSTGKWT